jgi:hypothetical protein
MAVEQSESQRASRNKSQLYQVQGKCLKKKELQKHVFRRNNALHFELFFVASTQKNLRPPSKKSMNACLPAMTLALEACTRTADSLKLDCLLKTAVKFQQCLQAEDQKRAQLRDTLNNVDAELGEFIADLK